MMIAPLALILALLFSLLSVSHASGAAQNTQLPPTGSVALRPVYYDPSDAATRSYFVLNTHASAQIQDQVRVINAGTTAGKVDLFVVDATTGQNTGAIYPEAHPTHHDVGGWIRLSQSSLVLGAGQNTIIPFSLSIPDGARPGQHLGGIVAHMTPLNANGAATSPASKININVQMYTVIAVQVTVDGPQIEDLQANGIQVTSIGGDQDLLLNLRNTGNMMLKPSGSLQVLDSSGKQLQNIPLNLDTFLPATAISYPAYVQHQALGAGTYQARLTLHYGNQHTLHYQSTFTITVPQIQHFMAQRAIQLPPSTATGLQLPLWLEVSLGIFAVLGILFIGQLVLRFWRSSRTR